MPPFLQFLQSILQSKIKLLLQFDTHNLSELTSNFKQKSYSRKLQVVTCYTSRSSIILENALCATQQYYHLYNVFLLVAYIRINIKILLLVLISTRQLLTLANYLYLSNKAQCCIYTLWIDKASCYCWTRRHLQKQRQRQKRRWRKL